MAKAKKKVEEVKDEDFFGDTTPAVEEKEVEKSKDKVLLGYHPITGEEVWK
jgi:topoisomerase IA-like protein